MVDIAKENDIVNEERQAYDDMINLLMEARDNNAPIDEGIVKAVIGGLSGVTIGPTVMKGVAKVLGITPDGALYNLMTSRLIVTALAAYLGAKN